MKLRNNYTKADIRKALSSTVDGDLNEDLVCLRKRFIASWCRHGLDMSVKAVHKKLGRLYVP